MTPTLLWFRRDLRLQDHAALTAALSRGGPVIAVFICDTQVETLGSAPKWRLGAGVAALQTALAAKGNRLILRRGAAIDVIPQLVEETGAMAVYWQRAYDPESQARDAKVKATLSAMGLEAKSFKGHLLFEPWTVQTKLGGFYKVYTPLWRAVCGREVPAPCQSQGGFRGPKFIPAPRRWAHGAWGAICSVALQLWHNMRGLVRIWHRSDWQNSPGAPCGTMASGGIFPVKMVRQN